MPCLSVISAIGLIIWGFGGFFKDFVFGRFGLSLGENACNCNGRSPFFYYFYLFLYLFIIFAFSGVMSPRQDGAERRINVGQKEFLFGFV